MFLKYIQLNNNFISMNEFASLLHKQPSFGKVLRKYFEQHMLDELIEITTNSGKTRKIPVFHYGVKKSNRPGFYIYKKILIPFVKRHINELEQLGIPRENFLATMGKIPVVYGEEKENLNLVNLWNLSAKCSYNSKITKDISHEIKRIYLTDTFLKKDPITGEEVETPMFVFVKPKMGQSGVFIHREAIPTFLNRHKEALKNFATLLEQSNQFISLRNFSRYLGTSANEGKLLRFINQHLDETYEKENENGTIEICPIFQFKKQINGTQALNIDKIGIKDFIIKYQDELIDMGFNGVHALLHNFDKKGFKKGYLSIRDIAQRLHQDSEFASKLTNIIHENYANDIVEKRDKKTQKKTLQPLFASRFQKRLIYFIKEEDFPLFCERYASVLKKLGLDKKAISHSTSTLTAPPKNDEMITFKEFSRILKRENTQMKSLLKDIKDHHLKDTYISSNENGKKEKKTVFVYAKNKRGGAYYFRNKEALLAFFKNQKQLLLTHGIKEELINYNLGKQKIQPYSSDYIFISELLHKLHIHYPSFSSYIKKHHLDETYEEVDENGQKKIKHMFVFMAPKVSGFGNYAIHKTALVQFAKRHQKLFNIKNEIIQSLENNTPLVKKQETHITTTQLTRFLNKTTTFTPFFVQKIKAHYLNETATIETKNGQETIPVFSQAYTRTGSISIYVDTRALPSFLERHKKELSTLGFKETSINNLIDTAKKDPFFHLPFFANEKERSQIRLKKYFSSREKRTRE